MRSPVQTGIGETGLTQKYAFIKTSTIFNQSLKNFDKIRYSWVPYYVKVDFLIKSYFWVSPVSPIPVCIYGLYLTLKIEFYFLLFNGLLRVHQAQLLLSKKISIFRVRYKAIYILLFLNHLDSQRRGPYTSPRLSHPYWFEKGSLCSQSEKTETIFGDSVFRHNYLFGSRC